MTTPTGATFHRILFATDFSDHSNQAARYAQAWAEQFEADLHLLHVVTIHNYDPFNPDLGFPDVGGLDRALHQAAERQMEELGISQGPKVTCTIRTGFSAWQEIVTTAVEMGTDLIVMATHGRKGLEKFFLGSTAEKVIERAPCPVLLLHPQAEEPPPLREVNRILLPTDLSEEAAQAAPMALDLAQRFDAPLTLLHCVEQEVPPAYLAAGVASLFHLDDDILDQTRRRMAELIPEDRAERIRHDMVIREGRAAAEIIGHALQAEVGLIVMATHGYSGLEQALLGSTTDRVIRDAPCPVLVVRCCA